MGGFLFYFSSPESRFTPLEKSQEEKEVTVF
jgi:hypothetical protein